MDSAAMNSPASSVRRRVRFARFVSVGVMGFVLQLTTLSVALEYWSLPYPIATLLAVEFAITHNFLWHERWTWQHRSLPAREWIHRFLGFQLANGLVSLIGNSVIMVVGIELFGTPPIPTNIAAVLACAATNFLFADRWVFIHKESR